MFRQYLPVYGRQRGRFIHLGKAVCAEKKDTLYIPNELSFPFKIIQRYNEVLTEKPNDSTILTNVEDETQLWLRIVPFVGDIPMFAAIKKTSTFLSSIKLNLVRFLTGLELKDDDVARGSQIVFEMMFQSMRKNSVENLKNREAFAGDVIDSVHNSIVNLRPSQREVFNITTDDILDFRSERKDIFRNLKHCRIDDKKVVAATYCVNWIALYKRKVLAEAVRKYDLQLDPFNNNRLTLDCKQAAMPKGYGFTHPRFISANMVFVHYLDKEDENAILTLFQYVTK